MLAQQLLNGLVLGSVYAIFALGFTLVFGVQHVMNLAHGAVFMWGSFFGLYVATELKAPLILAFAAAMIGAGFLNVALDFVAFRPLRKRGATELSALISSLGAALILINVAQRITEAQTVRFPFGYFPVRIFEFLDVRLTLLQLSIMAGAVILVVALIAYLTLTSLGRQVRAVAVDEATAGLLGVNPALVYFQTFFISGALAGAAGVTVGLAFNSVNALMGEPLLLRAFVVVVIGGLGSVSGAIAAGLLLGLVHTLAISYASSEATDMLIFSILFLVLVLRPTGLFPGFRREARIER